MKFHSLISIAIICTSLTGCYNRQSNNVVKETYIHKYGVPVAKVDWESQGKDGQVTQLRKDGVTVTTSYTKGVVNGPTSYSFPNSSTIHWVEMYANEELVSKRENYPSGVPKFEEILENKELVKLTRWYEDGTPQATENYSNTFLISAEYRTPLNIVESRIQDGHGTRICRSNEGELLSKDSIQNGQMVERITYFANGDPLTVTPYENGVIHGTRLTFLQGGIPNTVEQWIHGLQDGISIVYQNGEKISEIPYVRGKKSGTECRYRDGSLLAEEVSWKDNAMHGQRKMYVDGEAKIEWYHEGELVSRSTFERMNLSR